MKTANSCLNNLDKITSLVFHTKWEKEKERKTAKLETERKKRNKRENKDHERLFWGF